MNAQPEDALVAYGGNLDIPLPKGEETPIPFPGEDFLKVLGIFIARELLEEGSTQIFGSNGFALCLLMSASKKSQQVLDNLEECLEQYIGRDESRGGVIKVIDISLVPTEMVHIVTTVISRTIFEALQRYKKHTKKSLPTVIVMEEAHTFIKRYKDDAENQTAATACCQVFEKIAREGRKFGLGLVLSSQRPSELSPTVLSQCNSFLLHRISNDRDQELIGRLVPDNLRGLLRELPSLPSQQAILLGWATELPVMVQMKDLSDEERPSSDDPEFWDVWTGESSRNVDWKKIAEDWQGK